MIARFCLACGSSLVRAADARDVRKTVTVIFTDITGSTSLGERLDPETLRRLVGRYFEQMKAVVERHGGTVEKFIGDAIVAIFGIPQVHEDDALRAVRAVWDMREALGRLNDDLQRGWGVRFQTRTGVNTGEVMAGDPTTGQTFVTGDAVNVAARLEQAAQPDEVLVGDVTHRLTRNAVTVEPLPPLALKGKEEEVPVFRLLDVRPGAPGVGRRFDSPIVGRGRQLSRLQHAFKSSVEDHACQLFTVLGPAGVGKSRLAQEMLASIGDEAAVLVGRCPAYGDALPLLPIREVVTQAAGINANESPDDVRSKIAALVKDSQDRGLVVERLAQVMGLTEANAPSEEISWAVLELLETLARDRPLVVMLDDIHRADASLLDLVEHIVEWTGDLPILLLCLARRELLEDRPTWGGGKPNSTTMVLSPLPDDECGQLLENLMGRERLDPSARDRIVRATEGNPLFVEEVLSMLIDEGLIGRDGEQWVPRADLSRVPVPPTVHALVAARLDRLGGDERRVLECAAVVGTTFSQAAVSAIAAERSGDDVGAGLRALVRRDLLGRERGADAREPTFHFRHAVIREAAYQAIPKEVRARLHESCANWLQSTGGDRAAEYDELVGEHLERAYRYHLEVGRLDEQRRELAARAFDRLAASGRLALARGEMTAAADRLRRSLDLLEPDSPRWPSLLLDLGTSLVCQGRLEEAARLVAAAPEAADRGGARVTVSALLALWHGDPDAAVSAAQEALRQWSPEHDPKIVCAALDVMGRADDALGRRDEAAEAFRRWAEVAEGNGLTGSHVQALMELGNLQFLSGGSDEGLRAARDLARATGTVRSLVLSDLSLVWWLGHHARGEEAVSVAEEALDLCRRFRIDLLPHAYVAAGWARNRISCDDGEALLAEGLSRAPNDDDVAIIVASSRGDCALRAGRIEEAVAQHEQGMARMRAAPAAAPVAVPFKRVCALVLAGRSEDANRALDEARTSPALPRHYLNAIWLQVGVALVATSAELLDAAVVAARQSAPLERALALLLGAQVIGGPATGRWLEEAAELWGAAGAHRDATRARRLLAQVAPARARE